MSALTPLTKALRHEGAELIAESRRQHAEVEEAESAEERTVFMIVALTLARLGKVKLTVADQLDAEEQALLERFTTIKPEGGKG